jgi:hypothetical protein
MAERKTWEQMTKGERVGGMIGLGVVILLGFGIISGVANAIGSAGKPKQAETVQTATPVTTYKEVQETEAIPFEKVNQDDATRDLGTSAVTTPGQNGVKTKTFRLTLVDGKETARAEVGSALTTPAVNEVTSVGTKKPYVAPAPRAKASNCDSNYSGCVPIASDVDCAGGSGNGPAYVSGPVQVIGSDIYGLDRDGDGIGCE